MVDLSDLNLSSDFGGEDIAPPELYTDQSEFPPPVPEGVYTLQGKLREDQGAHGFSFSEWQSNGVTLRALVAVLDHTVVGGDYDGRLAVTFDRISAKPFKRAGVTVSSFTDHLRALGDKTYYPLAQAEAMADALVAAEGRSFQARLQWEAYCKECGEAMDDPKERKKVSVRGARRFPRGEDGKPKPVVPCPQCGQELQARARIVRRIPAYIWFSSS